VKSIRLFSARLALALLLAVGISTSLVGAAVAHDVLISSNPADGSTLTAIPSTITFTFDQPVQNFAPKLSMIGPDGQQYVIGTPQINGNVVVGTVLSGPAGRYTAAYRIVSADGHPLTGQVHFSIAVGALPAPGVAGSAAIALPPTVPGVPTAKEPATAGLSIGIWIALIVAALVLVAAATILLRRPGINPSADDY